MKERLERCPHGCVPPCPYTTDRLPSIRKLEANAKREALIAAARMLRDKQHMPGAAGYVFQMVGELAAVEEKT